MEIIEKFLASAKGDKTEDLIVETPDYFGIFDGVGGVRTDWLHEGRTMGQWGSYLAGEALKALPANATIADYSKLAAEMNATARYAFGLAPIERLASGALVLPRRKPHEVWVIGDSHFGYKLKSGEWKSCPQNKLYDEVTLNYRQILIKQEIMSRGMPHSQADRAELAQTVWSGVRDALSKQMLFANHPDPAERLGFGVVCGSAVPLHHLHAYTLPPDVAEIVLCSDGLPEAVPTADEGKAVIADLRATDPFLTGKNDLGFMGHKGGFVQLDGTLADWYDDVSYLRIGV
ncbi:MAG: hypothetical protein PSY14_04000 [bacterium]|nr:hypothetical protein [bacterium]